MFEHIFYLFVIVLYWLNFYALGMTVSLYSSLCIRPWEDILLISVLRGQNVSGIRKDKGKKDILIETMSVVLLRAELLQLQSRLI